MSYPTKEIKSGGKEDRNTGGSITYVKIEPDFNKFTKEDWAAYRQEEFVNSHRRLQWIIVGLVIALSIALIKLGF